MTFKSLVEQARKRKAYAGAEDMITFSHRKSGPKGSGGVAISFSVGPRLVTDAGLIKGDKIDLLWDPDDELGIIKRDNEKGRKFSMTPTGRIMFQLNWSEGMPYPKNGKKMLLSGTEVKHGEILFDLPTGSGPLPENE